jgi:hypothetical protein
MKAHVQADECSMNHSETPGLDRALRSQTPHATQDAIQGHAGVFTQLRNTFSLALVLVGVLGIMYLMFGNLAR